MTEKNGYDDRSDSRGRNVPDGGTDRDDVDPGENGETNGTNDEDESANDRSTHHLGSPDASTVDDELPIAALRRLEHRYDLEQGESVVDAVLSVVASIQECDPLELPPLYEAVDPNSLEATWDQNAAGTAGSDRVVWCTFVLDRTLVTVTSAGSIYATEFDDRDT